MVENKPIIVFVAVVRARLHGLVVSVILAFAPVTLGQTAVEKNAKGLESAETAREDRVTLDSTSTILLERDAPGPVEAAAQDLAADMGKVFGNKPKIVNGAEEAGSVTILIGEQSKLRESMGPLGLTEGESFSLSIINNSAREHRLPGKVVLLAGADMRGTIYAIYQFSEEYLGVDPLYFWTDHPPTRRARIELPGSLNKNFPAPVFKYRGFFINDEDLLTGWAPGEKTDHTGISLKIWNKIFETILRLKGNMVAPGTRRLADRNPTDTRTSSDFREAPRGPFIPHAAPDLLGRLGSLLPHHALRRRPHCRRQLKPLAPISDHGFLMAARLFEICGVSREGKHASGIQRPCNQRPSIRHPPWEGTERTQRRRRTGPGPGRGPC